MTTPVRVLFVEDSEDDMRLLVRQLRQGGYAPTVERVETADGLRSALHRGGWEIIISDYTMPRLSGLEALAVTLQLAPDVPFLLVSGTVGEEVAVESIKSGAADYLMKQNLIRFVPAVARALRDAAERRTMQRAEAVLREQRSLLGMIYDNISDALVLTTWEPREAAWKIASVNRATIAMAQSLGPDADEASLVGRRIEDLANVYFEGDRAEAEAVLDDFARAAESGRSRTRETRLSTSKNGLFVDLLLIPFFGPDGQTRHILAMVRDITARKRAEAARREFEARIAQIAQDGGSRSTGGRRRTRFQQHLNGHPRICRCDWAIDLRSHGGGIQRRDHSGGLARSRLGAADPHVQPASTRGTPTGSAGRCHPRSD